MKNEDKLYWQNSIADIYKRYRQEFMTWGKKTFRKADNALLEDVYQDAIIAFLEAMNANRYDPDKSNKKTYLFSIAKYMLIKKLKNKMLFPDTEIPDLSIEWVDSFGFEHTSDKNRQLQAAIDQLDKNCKNLLRAFYYKQKSMDEIALNMDFKNRNVVKVTKYRCLEKLRKILDV